MGLERFPARRPPRAVKFDAPPKMGARDRGAGTFRLVRDSGVFDRYNVVSDGDLRDAARRLGHTGGHTSPSLAFGGGEKTQNPSEILMR